MDSFELNKIIGAILGTCLVLLVTSFTAGAIFAPKMPEKPGFEIAVKEEAARPAARKPQLRPPSRSRSCCRPLRSRRAPPPPRSAPPATPSRRAAPTASVPTSTASSATKKGEGRGFNFSAAMKAKGGTWTYRRPQQVHRQPEGLRPRHRDGLCRHPEGQRARRRDRLSAYAGGKPGAAADGGEVTFRLRTWISCDQRPGLAWPFSHVTGSRSCYRDVSPQRNPAPGCYHEEKAT